VALARKEPPQLRIQPKWRISALMPSELYALSTANHEAV
jgi:hypothetical protein